MGRRDGPRRRRRHRPRARRPATASLPGTAHGVGAPARVTGAGRANRPGRVRGCLRGIGRRRRAPPPGRLPGVRRGGDAAPSAVVAARPACAAPHAARAAGRAAARGRGGMTDDLRTLFLRHVCQTSDGPMGLVVASARGATVRDVEGREYLDLLAGMGVANVGHAHPEVVAAVRAQADRHLHVMVYGEFVQDAQVRLAARLAGQLPAPLSVVYFTSSGAEAVDGALKTARKATGRPGFVAFTGGFHGDTWGALSIGGNPIYRRPFEPLLPGVTFLRFDDTGELDAIDGSTAAVIVEPVQ